MTKKSYKVMSKTAIAAALATATLVPSVVTFAAETTVISDIVIKKDNAFYKLSKENYDLSVALGKFSQTTTPIEYISVNGVTYDKDEYDLQVALHGNANALDKLVTGGTPVTVTTGTATIDGNGNVVTTPAPITDLEVIEVSAINAGEVLVKFNQNLLKASVEDETAYSIDVNNGTTVAASAAVLQADNKSVLLTLTSPLTDNDVYKVSVAEGALLAADYTEVTKYSGKNLTFKDEKAASLVSASYNGTDIEFTFDEPLDITNEVTKINGADVTLVDAYTTGEYVYTATTPLTPGTHSFVITGLVDLAGNETETVSGTVKVSNDTTAPKYVGAKAVDKDTFAVEFNEVIDASNLGTYTAKKGSQVLTTTSVAHPTNKKVVLVTVASADSTNPLYTADETAINISFNVVGYKDASLLVGSKVSGTVQLTTDTTGPSMVAKNLNVLATTNDEYKVLFNEDLAGLDTTKLTLKKSGIIQPTAIDTTNTTINSSNPDELDVLFGTVLTAGSYTLEFAEGAVEDAVGNSNSAFSVGFNVGAVATYFVPTAVNIITANTIEVDFGTDVTDSALALSNYKLDGLALPTGSKIEFYGDKESVLLTLPTSFKIPADATYTLSVSDKVVNTDGSTVAANATTGGTYKETLTLLDNVKPTLVSAKLVKVTGSETLADTITLTFSEDVAAVAAGDLATLANDFIVNVEDSAVTYNVASAVSAGKEIVLTLADEVNVAQTVTVETAKAADISITDNSTNTNLLVSGTKVTATK